MSVFMEVGGSKRTLFVLSKEKFDWLFSMQKAGQCVV